MTHVNEWLAPSYSLVLPISDFMEGSEVRVPGKGLLGVAAFYR